MPTSFAEDYFRLLYGFQATWLHELNVDVSQGFGNMVCVVMWLGDVLAVAGLLRSGQHGALQALSH
jgi:hypothetical protein